MITANLFRWRNFDMERIIYRGPGFCAVQEDGILVEYLDTDKNQQYGDIILGRTERMMPGIGCAFVNIGRKLSGFLPLQENSLTFSGPELCSGMSAAVQIKKEETGGKGAYLSRDLTFSGRYVLMMPMNRFIGVSSRIQDENEREKLRETGRRVSGGRFGLVMRTASLSADPMDIEKEANELFASWLSVKDNLNNGGKAGTVLYHQDAASRLITDYAPRGIYAVRETECLPPDLQRQLKEAGKRKVTMKNGGTVVIDRCEAMTVIDVNTASSRPESDKEASFLETNLSACKTIAVQIRLRNLSGIILIDFIDMEEEKSRKAVSDKLQELLKEDRRKSVLHGWTKLGLMEMTRKRTET